MQGDMPGQNSLRLSRQPGYTISSRCALNRAISLTCTHRLASRKDEDLSHLIDPALRERRGGFSMLIVGLYSLEQKANATSSSANTYCRLVLIDPKRVDGVGARKDRADPGLSE